MSICLNSSHSDLPAGIDSILKLWDAMTIFTLEEHFQERIATATELLSRNTVTFFYLVYIRNLNKNKKNGKTKWIFKQKVLHKELNDNTNLYQIGTLNTI